MFLLFVPINLIFQNYNWSENFGTDSLLLWVEGKKIFVNDCRLPLLSMHESNSLGRGVSWRPQEEWERITVALEEHKFENSACEQEIL